MTLKLHPLAGGSFANLVRLLSAHRVEPQYFPKLITTATISLLGAPGRQLSRLKFNAKADALAFKEDPVFILGHWRSGTTYLHHLMSQDPHFSYVSSYQAWAPELFLKDSVLTRYFVERSLPKKRPIDNIELSLQKPEEEEFVMANVTPHSYIHTFFFPQDTRDIFRRAVLFEGLSASERAAWETRYVRSLKLASLSMGGRRPLVKSPANTARISTLLKRFPQAKFIHIYRNPYVVFLSQRHTCAKLIELWQLQSISLEEIEENILWSYQQLMERFFAEKALIPPGNLIELQYETFESHQLESLAQIYATLNLEHFDRVKPDLSAYIDSQASYQKNHYQLEPATIDKIYAHWQFTIDRWGYTVPKN
ncbi:MAG: sulfotransferase [Leptolyngbya sp. SIO4C1]|nr:sulfotransferase [Leptolyngbya sp. SIO4C1]